LIDPTEDQVLLKAKEHCREDGNLWSTSPWLTIPLVSEGEGSVNAAEGPKSASTNAVPPMAAFARFEKVAEVISHLQ